MSDFWPDPFEEEEDSSQPEPEKTITQGPKIVPPYVDPNPIAPSSGTSTGVPSKPTKGGPRGRNIHPGATLGLIILPSDENTENKTVMEKVKKYLNEYQPELISGVAAVALGMLVKSALKKEMLPLGSARKIAESFVFVSVAGVIGHEINKMATP